MLSLTVPSVVGLDLAGSSRRPTGWALISGLEVKTCHLYSDEEIINETIKFTPILIAIDAPLSFPKKGSMRLADKQMHKLGYPVLPPTFPAMKTLTERGIRISNELIRRGFKVIEVHPTSTRKALKMPIKDWKNIQKAFKCMGFIGEINERRLSPHELDALSAALTAYLYIKNLTISVGEKENAIIVPIERDWRSIKIEV